MYNCMHNTQKTQNLQGKKGYDHKTVSGEKPS